MLLLGRGSRGHTYGLISSGVAKFLDVSMQAVKRVVCAISGGVDSAVAALLLKRRGYEVLGVHMVNWDSVEEGSSECPQTKDEADARKVCHRLQIPFYVANFIDAYWNEIFTYLIENYRKGRTVVSDVLCNKNIKFDRLHKFAFDELQADAVATGHFARTNFGDFLEKNVDASLARLLMASDPIKDQTYFLSTLSQMQLKRSVFPVGSFNKRQVRQIAADANLHEVADKPESMGICFIGKKKNFDRFMDQYIEPIVGEAKDIDTGKIIFEHGGLHHYTVGKRIRFAPVAAQSPVGLFAAALEEATHTLWVCRGSYHPVLFAREFMVKEPEWISISPFKNTVSTTLEFRCQRTHPAMLSEVTQLSKGWLKVKPYNPIRAAAPGQMCVFYDGNECLGGGEIERVISTLAD